MMYRPELIQETEISYADRLFDNSYVHQIDVRLADKDWTGLLADPISEMLLPWVEKDPTAFCSADEFRKACETMRSFLAIRTESIRRQLAGELSAVSEAQEKQDMVDASGLDLSALGALTVGHVPD